MALLIRQKVWSQQPQRPVELDWGNPLTPDFLFSGGSGGVLLGRKWYLATGHGTSDVFQPSKYGIGYKPTRVTNAGLDFGAVQPIKGDAWTVLVLANPTNSAVSTLFSQRNGSVPYNQIDLVVNSNDSLTYRAGGFSGIALGFPSGARGSISQATTFADGNYHVFGASRSSASSTIDLLYDGNSVSATFTGTGTNPVISTAQKTRIGNIGDYTADAAYVAEANIPLVFIYNRVLTANEVVKVSADMLNGVYFWAKREASRLFISTVSGGSTSLTISDTTHTHAVDSLTFSLDTYLAASASTHGHLVDNITLDTTSTVGLVASDTTHAHVSDNQTLTLDSFLAVSNSSHVHTSDNLVLTLQVYLAIAAATHSHFADNLGLDTSGTTTLTTQDTNHAHVSDSSTLSLDTWLAITSAVHALISDNITLSASGQASLIAQDATHAHGSDSPLLSAEETLAIASALHDHFANVLVLSFPSVGGSISPEDIAAIAAAVLAALQATTIPVDTKKMNGATILGTGIESDKWRGNV